MADPFMELTDRLSHEKKKSPVKVFTIDELQSKKGRRRTLKELKKEQIKKGKVPGRKQAI